MPELDLVAWLAPFELQLSPTQQELIKNYLELLLKWNRRINLVSVRSAQECVTRHFGESLYLARWEPLAGRLLDVGSGAGFPGLALKIVFPDLSVTLLEAVAKKRAFLKEVTRACGFDRVEVRGERLEQFTAAGGFDAFSSRGVGEQQELAKRALEVLKPGGKICLWLGREQRQKLVRAISAFAWRQPIALPLSREREIVIGFAPGWE